FQATLAVFKVGNDLFPAQIYREKPFPGRLPKARLTERRKIKMARRVKVSSVGKQPPLFPREEKVSGDLLVEQMVAVWQGHIAQVLPDRPDLIVLPEMADRYFSTPRELLPAYRRALGDV